MRLAPHDPLPDALPGVVGGDASLASLSLAASASADGGSSALEMLRQRRVRRSDETQRQQQATCRRA